MDHSGRTLIILVVLKFLMIIQCVNHSIKTIRLHISFMSFDYSVISSLYRRFVAHMIKSFYLTRLNYKKKHHHAYLDLGLV